MPLSFERRWSLDRRKDDKKEDKKDDKKDDKSKDKEKKSKKEKKKYKTKLEEQMAHQIEELNRQIIEERQNTRREKLSVARLQRELAKAKSEGTMKETTMRELMQEREARTCLEEQLEGAVAENKSCNAQLEALQEEIMRLRSASSVDSLCDNAESCKRLQNGLSSTDTGLSDVERENCNVVVSNKQLELKVVSKEEVVREKSVLLERLRQLESENSALVLENENQRGTYDQCLDEVANQVVQALLMQKDLRDECLKLHGRVRDLELQNRNLRCLFDQNRFKPTIPSPLQSSSHQQYGSYSGTSPGLAGCSIPVLTPSASTHSSPSPASPGLYAPFTHPLRTKHQQSEPGPTGSTPDSGKDPPLSPHLLQGQTVKKLDHSGSPVKTSDQSKETNPHCDSYQRLVRQQYQQYRHHHSQQQLQQQRTLPQEIFRQLSAPANYPAPSSPHQAMQQGRTPGHRGLDQMYPFLPYQCEVQGVEGAGEGMGMEDYSWTTSPPDAFPSSIGHSSLPNTPGRMGVHDETLNGNLPFNGSLGARIAKMQVMGEDRLGRNSPPEVPDGRNGYILGDQYTKPYVHAPFHYAQSLLKELQEISASVKSFESLTLEPKANHQQKRKANDGQPVLQRQKLAKNFSPSASNASSESLNSATSPRHLNLMDSTSSVTSTESMETTLERIPPTVLSHSSPLRQEHHLQWRPEYGGNKVPDRTSPFPPDTPSPPTTDIEPSERDYQHSRYLRSRQHSGGTHHPEREHEIDSKVDVVSSVGRGNVNKAIDRYQEKVKNSTNGRRDNAQLPAKNQVPVLSMRDKDAINEAQRNLQISQENEMACGRVSHLPVRDDGKQGAYSVQNSSITRSKFGGVTAQVQNSSTGYSAEKTNSDEDVLESVTSAAQVKPKLSRQQAAESVNQNLEILPGEGSKHLCQKTAKSQPVNSLALPQLRDNDPNDTSGPIWKRKSQMEEYRLDVNEKRGEGKEEVDESEGTDSRVASFMTAPDGKVKEQDGKLLSKYENRTNGEVSPKHFAGKIQSPKSCRKSSLPFPIPSALTLATSKPSGVGLSQSVGSIAKADVGIVDGMKSAQSGDAVLERLETNKAVMSDESSTTEGTKDASATKPVLSTGEVEARRDEGSKSSVKVQGNVAGGEKIRQQIPVRTSREATESLLQKTKMQFNRGEVGRCSLGAKMTQLSKIGAPSPADRPLQSHHSTGRGPLAMAASSKAIDVPVLDSSPRLPGRRQMTPEHLRSGRDALGDMVEFTSQSIEERASVQSMSTESLQSANSLGSSADWDSPSKNSSTSKQPSASSLGNLLSSDSESEEEESVNFVDMWKARSTPPIKLPDWDPNKSIEEHRKRVRESLERSESASSASSEQWILSYPLPEDPLARGGRSSTTGPSSRQSSVGSMTRQDSSHSRSGVSCDEDRKILQELLEKERKAQSRSNSSDSSPEGRKENQQVVGSNLSLGEKSIMCDFMSSIMAEVKLEDAQQGGKSQSKGSKDDLTRPKKLSSPFIRSQSMRAPPKPSRPERTRIPSGGNMDNRKVNTNIPKPQAANSKSIASAKKIDTTSTKSPKTFQQNHSSNESKKNGSGLTRTFMPKAFTKTANKAASDSPNMNPSRSGVASPAASEKSGGKTKKSNLKNGKGKGKWNECTKSTNVGAKDPESGNKDSKSKSKIPQLIRQGFKPSPWKGDSSKKKGTPRKEMVVESPKTSPAGSEMLRTETPSDSNKSAFTEVFPLTKQSSFIVDNVPFMDDSSKSPNKDENPNQTPSPNDEKNPFTSHLDQRGEALCGQSPKLSPRLLQRLRANGIELANSSGSDNDSVFLPDEPRPSTLQVDPALPCQMSNGSVTRHCQQTERTENGSTSELHLDQKEIEDIKNGLLVSESDALSIGSWSAKSSEFGLKNSFLFGNGDFGNVGTPTSRSLGRGSLGRESLGRESIGRGSLAPSVSSNPEDATGGVRAADDEVDPKKYDVPLVSTDMMEDFEAEDLCDEDGMSSDREKEAQLTEKERANLLDSLFESDDSEGGLDGFLDESSESLLDSHPDEKEFMKLLGDKGMKRQVVRQSVYCRVSLIQMDVFSLYNRFDDQEKEALACFDFLEEMYMNNAGETLFTDDHPFSVISPGVRSGNSESFGDSGGIVDQFGSKGTIKECFDTSLMQAGDTTSSLFGDDPSEATLVGESFTSKGSIGDGLNVNSEPSSGDFSEHFDGDSFSSRHSNKVFDGCYAIGDFSDHLGNRSNLCSSMSSSSTASLSSHE